MPRVSALWRYPIKSHGREAIESIMLEVGKTIPWDRHWAVTHTQSKFNPANPAWAGCRNFMIGSMNPGLAGLWATLDEGTQTVTLRHDNLGEVVIRPDDATDATCFADWVAPLCRSEDLQPTGIVTAPGRGMTDTDYPTLSIMNIASHQSVADRLGHPLEQERWRGNIWLDGLEAWEEFDWIGKDVTIGDAVINIRDRIERCNHTKANPRTGQRDVDTLTTLETGWGHTDFGIYGVVTKAGRVNINDKAKVH